MYMISISLCYCIITLDSDACLKHSYDNVWCSKIQRAQTERVGADQRSTTHTNNNCWNSYCDNE